MSKTRGPVSNVVYVFRGDEVINKFSTDTATDKAKNPQQQAKLFLKEILGNKEHELYSDLMGGKMSMISGHPEKLEPKTTLSL